jgi:hypothetical protein
MSPEDSRCPFRRAASKFEHTLPRDRPRVAQCEILHLTISREHSQFQFVIFARQPIEGVPNVVFRAHLLASNGIENTPE